MTSSRWRNGGTSATGRSSTLSYLFSGTLTANFFLVFATGILLYLLEQATICFAIAKASHNDGQLA